MSLSQRTPNQLESYVSALEHDGKLWMVTSVIASVGDRRYLVRYP